MDWAQLNTVILAFVAVVLAAGGAYIKSRLNIQEDRDRERFAVEKEEAELRRDLIRVEKRKAEVELARLAAELVVPCTDVEGELMGLTNEQKKAVSMQKMEAILPCESTVLTNAAVETAVKEKKAGSTRPAVPEVQPGD